VLPSKAAIVDVAGEIGWGEIKFSREFSEKLVGRIGVESGVRRWKMVQDRYLAQKIRCNSTWAYAFRLIANLRVVFERVIFVVLGFSRVDFPSLGFPRKSWPIEIRRVINCVTLKQPSRPGRRMWGILVHHPRTSFLRYRTASTVQQFISIPWH